MENAIKLIVPLLDDNFKKEDFTEENGFVEGYFYDINRPQARDSVFLMFEGKLNTPYKMERHFRILKMPAFCRATTIYINKKPYLLYIFEHTTNKTITKCIEYGLIPTNKEDFMKIIFFWNLQDSFINSLIYNRTKEIINTELVVPEEDYRPSLEEEFGLEGMILPKPIL